MNTDSHIERTRDASVSEPTSKPGPQGRTGPNIVVILMDDMGWSDVGCYGSEISTPNIDRLAASGIRLTHYTTHPLCSPARAALLTGRNAHAVGSGWLANNHQGFPGYSGEIPGSAATIAETLRARGYETILCGKWHNTPVAETSPGGDKSSWPTQRGFETFYGFMGGETSQFFPSRLMLNNQVLDLDEYPGDYYAGDDWTDSGIRFLKELRASRPDKPFFLCIANTAVHSPLQAKQCDLEKYAGAYDCGWDVARARRLQRQKSLGLLPANVELPARDRRAPAWEDCPAALRRTYARHMEAYAAMLDNADQNVGKLLACLESIGELEDTIVVFTSDNGGTDSGGPHGTFNHNRLYSGLNHSTAEEELATAHLLGGPQSMALYPSAWGQVSNTPFPTYKTYTGGGGRRVSFVVSWPCGISSRGAVSKEFMHVTDVMPTLLELAGLEPLATVNGEPAQGLDGVSLAGVLTRGEESPRFEQYYECWSNRGYYRDGWFARSLQIRGEPIDLDRWSLFHLEQDPAELHDLAGQEPQKLQELVDAFDQAAWLNLVYPLDNRRLMERLSTGNSAPDVQPRCFFSGAQTVPRVDVLPLVSNRCFKVRTRVVHGEGDEGVLWAIGDLSAGMVLYIEQGALQFGYNGFGAVTRTPPVTLVADSHEVLFEFEALGQRSGRGRLCVDSQPCHEWQDMSPTLMFGPFEGLDVGIDRRAPVLWSLFERRGSFPYSGSISSLWVEPGPRIAG
jgi:arylsulfatase A-like enzyme